MKNLFENNILKKFRTKQCSKKEQLTVASKPKPLIGGSEVYQKDNNTPYWYCKIKDGRDEFMYVPFEDITKKDLLYDINGNKRKFVSAWEKDFKVYALKALKNKPVNGYCWLPVYEPSKSSNGTLQYVAGAEVLRNISADEWEEMFIKYSIENGSRQATATVYILLLLRWLKDGIVTFQQLVHESQKIGHYSNSDKPKNDFEKTGEREFGGLYGFIGNTRKIVKDPESKTKFSIFGGDYVSSGTRCSAVYMVHMSIQMFPLPHFYATGLLQLTK